MLLLIVFKILFNKNTETFESYKCRMNKKICFGKDKKFHDLSLSEFVKINNEFNKNGIKGFLCGGTILGYVRENDFLRNDDDISIGIFANKNTVHKVKQIFKKFGYRSKAYLFKLNNKLEIGQFTFKKRIDNYEVEFDIEFYFNDDVNNKYVTLTFWRPMAYYPFEKFGLKKTRFLNNTFYIPENPVKWVEQHFGKDWKVEKPMFHNTQYGNRLTKYNRSLLKYFE